MAKVLNIRFEFTDEEWAAMKERLGKDASIRQALYEGALGEVEGLLEYNSDGSSKV